MYALLEVKEHWLTEQMAKSAKWSRLGPKGALIPADPAPKYAKHLLARTGVWPFRVLKGLVYTPTLRADGSILQSSGYDEQSQLIYEPGDTVFPSIPENPTKEEAQAALQLLASLFRKFPFADDASRSVILAAVLTGLIRRSIRTAPLFAIDAPAAGTGKSLLSEIIAILITGSLPAMLSQGKNEEEDEKRLSTILRAGDPLIVLDNCDLPLEGDFLCSMLTQEMVQARILGRSERVLLPSNCVVIATGNNLTLSGDMSRRAVICRIDAKTERPDARQFEFDPRVVAREKRGELVAAGLTVLRAYISAGKPTPLPKIGSFEEWNIVREALVWLDHADPGETRTVIMANDPRKAELAELINAWHACYGNKAKTLAEVRADCEALNAPTPNRLLYQLLVDLTGRPVFNARSIGRNLRRHLGRIVDSKILMRKEDSHGASWWVAEHVPLASRNTTLMQFPEE